MAKSKEISLESFIDFIKRKMTFIASKEINSYILSLGWDPDTNKKLDGYPPKYRPSKMPQHLQRWIADCLKTEMNKQNVIEINERKGSLRDVKPMKIEIINTKEISGSQDKDSKGGTGGVTEADGRDSDSGVEDTE